MCVTLEKAADADAAEILSLYHAAARYGRVSGSSDWDDEYPSMETIRDDLAVGGLYVYRENGKIAATVSLIPGDDLDEEDVGWSEGKSCVLCRLCVSPGLQNAGLGAKITQAAGALKKAEGFSFIHLMAAAVNQVSLHLYQKLGLREMGERVLYGENFCLFEYRL